MELTCPGCHQVFETATSVLGGEPAPAAGARTVCTACHTVGVFADGPFGLYLRPATAAELVDWAAGGDGARVMRALLEAPGDPAPPPARRRRRRRR